MTLDKLMILASFEVQSLSSMSEITKSNVAIKREENTLIRPSSITMMTGSPPAGYSGVAAGSTFNS